MDVTLTNCIILTVVAISISIGGMFVVRQRVSLANLRMHHDVTDPLLAVLGTLFAILLGFMLANSMQRFEEARSNIQEEAGAVGDVFRLSDGLPAQAKEPIRKNCLAYIDLVVHEEWPLMQQGKLSDKAWNVVGDLWTECLHYEPQTQGQVNVHQLLVGAMTHLGECRRARAAELAYCLPRPLWFVLLFGGITTIAFTFFFAVESVRLQILMTSVITMIICLNIYMLAGYDAPFSGDIALTPAAFETAQSSLEKIASKQWH